MSLDDSSHCLEMSDIDSVNEISESANKNEHEADIKDNKNNNLTDSKNPLEPSNENIEKAPNYVYLAAGKCYEKDSLICHRCKKQIHSSTVYIHQNIEEDTKDIVIYCTTCAELIKSQAKFCEICKTEIKPNELHNSSTIAQITKGKFYHRHCLHCSFCSEINDDPKHYSLHTYESDNTVHSLLICQNCIRILNGCSVDSEKPIVGQFVPELLPEDFINSCQQCGNEFVHNVYIYENGRLLCVNCSETFCQE